MTETPRARISRASDVIQGPLALVLELLYPRRDQLELFYPPTQRPLGIFVIGRDTSGGSTTNSPREY